MRGLPDHVSLARGLRLLQVRSPLGVRLGWPPPMAVRLVPYQVSVTPGTVLHNSKTPLTTWLRAAYLMTTDKRGLSALLLQRQLGIGRYETAWMILHKLRRAMVNVAREPLRAEVELDERWVGGTQAGLRGSRQLRGRRAALVLVAVERRGRAAGRVRMGVTQPSRRCSALAAAEAPRATSRFVMAATASYAAC